MVTKKERPILFSTDMVKAIMAGRKTMTRRVLNPQPGFDVRHTGVSCFTPKGSISLVGWFDTPSEESGRQYGEKFLKIPYGSHGDQLWVRETWAPAMGDFAYKADYSQEVLNESRNKGIWKPSIHMPKDAARIWLEITSIGVERLQDISYQDAKAEGIEPIGENCEGATLFRNYENPPDYIAEGELSSRLSFRSLWDSINSKPGNRKPVTWNSNPWVWVISFKVLSTTGKPNQFQQLEKEYRNGC